MNSLCFWLISSFLLTNLIQNGRCADGDNSIEAVSTSLSKSLTRIFSDVAYIPWTALVRVVDTGRDVVAVALQATGEVSKGAGAVIHLTRGGADAVHETLVKGLDYTNEYYKDLATNVGSGLNSIGGKLEEWSKTVHSGTAAAPPTDGAGEEKKD